MLILPPKVSDYFSITSKNTHTLPASSERASTHSVDKGKIWCVENCKQGGEKGNFTRYWSITPAPCFFPFLWGLGKTEHYRLLICTLLREIANRNHASHWATAIKHLKKKVHNFKFICKHEKKKSLLSVQATLQWTVQKTYLHYMKNMSSCLKQRKGFVPGYKLAYLSMYQSIIKEDEPVYRESSSML